MTRSRAESFSPGATASSRSRKISSAASVGALARKRSEDPGTAWQVRRDRCIAPDRSLRDMPERPEAERARQQIEKALNREIVDVDDSDSYVSRPHSPGEIKAALVGRTLTKAHRRGKFLWVEAAQHG